MAIITPVRSPVRQRQRRHHPLLRHYLEMVAAMFVAMGVFAVLVSLVLRATGTSDVLEHVAVRAPLMATYMAIGMSLLMRYRKHTWAAVVVMSLAMYVPMLCLLVPCLFGLIPGWAVIGPMHVLMLLAMAVIMRRNRAEYVR